MLESVELELNMSSSALAEIATPSLSAALERNFEASAPIRRLRRNEMLFEAGDLKTDLYRVETGALCVYATEGEAEVIEFALAGDVVGMGFLERHTTSARATVETTLRSFPLADLDRLKARDERNRTRFHAAVEREFKYRRDALAKASSERPTMRVAAFLIALSSRNRLEGRDPAIVDDALNSAVTAQYLGLSVDLLALALVQLELQGIIIRDPHSGLRLTNLAALNSLADGSDAGV
jgi:CRP/FNR family transcriptional regulator